MTQFIRVSEEFHEYVVAHKRDEETLRRLAAGPHPEDVAGIVSPETADEMRARCSR